MPFRRVLLALFSLLLVAGAAFALMGGEARRELLGQEAKCPPGYLGAEQLELRERRERRARGETEKGDAERKREEALGEGTCRAAKGPEPIGELMQIQNESGRRARGGQAGVKTGAYASAVADAKRIATASGTLPGSAGEWTPAGKGPLIGDDKRYDEVNGAGSGRPERPAVGLRLRPEGPPPLRRGRRGRRVGRRREGRLRRLALDRRHAARRRPSAASTTRPPTGAP